MCPRRSDRRGRELTALVLSGRFTQTVYRSFQPGEPGEPLRQYDASLLTEADCPSRHWTVMIEVFPVSYTHLTLPTKA